jgi:uncharacterized protein
MRLNEVVYTDAKPVDGYGPGFFRIGGDVYEGASVVLPSGIVPWGGFEDAQTMIDAADGIDVVFIGTGAEIAYIPAEFRKALEDAGLGVEVMSSPTACRTYNVVLSEGRRVGLALLPV